MNIEQILISHLLTYAQNVPEACAIIDGKKNFFTDKKLSLVYETLKKLNAENKPLGIHNITLSLSATEIGKDAPLYIMELMNMEAGLLSEFHGLIFRGVEMYLMRQLNEMHLSINSALGRSEHPLLIMETIQNKLNLINSEIEFSASQSLDALIKKTFREIINNFEGQTPPGISTGFDALNKIHGAFMPGTLSVLAARPAMGKTAFAMSLAVNAARRGHSVLFFSIEMSYSELCARLLSSEAMIPNNYVLKNAINLTAAEINKIGIAADKLSPLKININDGGNMTISKLRSGIQRTRPELVVIDYLQILTPSSQTQAADTNKFFEEATRDLKIISKEFNCAIILLSQLNRGVEARTDKRPLLSDLRSSGGIEQNADSVLFIHRPYYYNKEAEIDMAEIIIGKNRNGGVGICELRFMDVFTKFADREPFRMNNIKMPYPDNEKTPF